MLARFGTTELNVTSDKRVDPNGVSRAEKNRISINGGFGDRLRILQEEDKIARKAKWKAHLNPERAQGYLQHISYISELDNQIPGTIAEVSLKSEFVEVKAGEILFRQKDSPARLFYIVSGEVEVLVNSGDDPPTPDLVDTAVVGCCGRKRFELLPREDWRATFEGFSTFCEESSLGKQVATLGPGKIFGDDALKNDRLKRNATIRVTTDTEFLTVHKENFDIKMCAMLHFLSTTPGFRDFNGQRDVLTKTISVFQERVYKRGQFLLREGYSEGLCMFVIVSGKVAFRRKERIELFRQPCKAAFQDDRDIVREAWSHAEKNHGRCWQVLQEHDIFCSMGMYGVSLSTNLVEPNSAIVRSDRLVVYQITGETMEDFDGMKPEILRAMVEHSNKARRPALQQSGGFCSLHSLEPPKMISFENSIQDLLVSDF